MFTCLTKIRVRYGETDRMGYVYYGNYMLYYEVGRVEALRDLGYNYREMEDSGIMLPVYTMNVKYIKPAVYDDELTIKTTIKEIPSTKISFDYEVYNSADELLNKAEVTLVFVNKTSGRPCLAPDYFINALKKYFTK